MTTALQVLTCIAIGALWGILIAGFLFEQAMKKERFWIEFYVQCSTERLQKIRDALNKMIDNRSYYE